MNEKDCKITDNLADNTIRHIFIVARHIHLRTDAMLDEVGLSGAKLWALHHLIQAEAPMRVTQLAEEMGTGKSNITQLIDRLEADGLVRRTRNPADRRSILIELTDEAIERHTTGDTIRREMAAELLEPLAHDEQQQLCDLLHKLLNTPEVE